MSSKMEEARMTRQGRARQSLVAVAHRAAASIDWLDSSKHSSWGGPMNGQTGRQQIVRSLLGSQGVERVIETGTFRGTTTQFLLHVSGAPVYSVETSARFHHFAQRRLKGHAAVHLSLGDSRAFLDRLSTDAAATAGVTFFYLDAHWGPDCPLADEIRLIAERWPDPLILIDDFAVPHDAGYGFDVYPDGKPFDLGCLPREQLGDFRVLFPALPADQETGARRGCALLVRGARAESIAAQVPGLVLEQAWP